MNERIRELSSQARDYAREYVADCKQHGYYMEHNEFDLQFESKFAELIVRECVQVGNQAWLKDNSTVPAFPSNQIKEHFGVEK
jgi:hypothetical protein